MRAILFFILLTPFFSLAQHPASVQKLHAELRKQSPGIQKVRYYDQLISEVQGLDPVLSRQLIHQLYQLSDQINSPEGEALAHYQNGVYYNMKGKFDSLLLFAEKCMAVSKKNNLPFTQAFADQLTGTYYWQTGQFDKALNFHLKALRIREKLNDQPGIGSSLASLGAVSLSNDKLPAAKNYSTRALEIAEEIRDHKLMLRSLHTLANVYGTEGKYSRALAFDEQALKICAVTGNKRSYAEIYSNMALCFFYLGNYQGSINYHEKVLEIDRFFNDDKQIGDTYLNLAAVYAAKKDNQKAEELLNRSVNLFLKTRYKSGLRNAYELLSKTYQQMGDDKNALAVLQKYLQVASEINNEKNDQNIARLNVQYETEKREQKIKELSQNFTIQKLEIQRRNILLAIASGVIVVVFVFAYLLINRRKLLEHARFQKELNKQQQLAAKAVFAGEEQERRRIAAELHDGVGQTLSCALMNLNRLFENLMLKNHDNDLARRSMALLADGYDEMRSISHQMIPNSLLKNGLASALTAFIGKIDKPGLIINLDVSGMHSQIDAQTETAIYRVVQEAVNNVIKHSKATKLFISVLSHADDGIEITVEDNGIGFDLAAGDMGNGIGLQNIKTRIGFLKGSVEIDSSPGRGTLLAINIPAALCTA